MEIASGNSRQLNCYSPITSLSARHIKDLVGILETRELWKGLMVIIPEKVKKNNFACDITWENQRKYSLEQFRIMEITSEKYGVACTEMLLFHWGRTDRVQPALGHLLYLLRKAKLFRAADYVAVDILGLEEEPQRPCAATLMNLDETIETVEKDEQLERRSIARRFIQFITVKWLSLLNLIPSNNNNASATTLPPV